MVTRTKLYINGKDAYVTWGLQLDGGDQSGYDALLALKPLKEPVTNKNVTAQGAVVVCGTGLVDERTVSVPVHIVANSYTDFKEKKNSLLAELKTGALTVVVKRQWNIPGTNKSTEDTEFSSTMYFVGSNQYTQFSMVQNKVYNQRTDTWHDVVGSGYGMAKFILSLYEPNEPTI